MKRFMLMALLISSLSAFGQNPARVNREQLKQLNYLVGNWKGTAVIQQQGGTSINVMQEEKVTWQLDSLLMMIEGVGKDPASGRQNFHAIGFLSYNQVTQQLAMRSYTHEGRQTDAYFKILEPTRFEWGFDLPGNRGKIKYTIVLSEKDKSWNEVGEFSADGSQWRTFMTLDLVKQ
jgi:hypothetical protein